jgi:chromosome segregation ATPase
MFGNDKQIFEKFEKQDKDIKKIKDELKEIKETLASNTKTLDKFFEILRNVSEGQNSILETSSSAQKDLESKGEHFDRIIRKLDQTNQDISQRTFSKISSAVEEELSKIRTDVTKFNSLKDEISEITKHLDYLKNQLVIMNTISSKIKEKDFELVNYAQRIEKIEREKNSAIEESERVKDILAKMVKGRNQQRPFNKPRTN